MLKFYDISKPGRWKTGLATVLVAAATAGTALAQQYPTQEVQVIVPNPAGGLQDTLARVFSEGMSSTLGKPFVVVNQTGAGGAVGSASVVNATPDGHKLLFGAAVNVTVLPFANPDANYKPEDLHPVCQTTSNVMALVINKDSPIKTIADLVTAAKADAGSISYGHPGKGTIPHLAMVGFVEAAGIELLDVPERGDAITITNVMGGHLDLAAIGLGSAAGKDVHVLGIFGESRHRALPDTPTFKESGYDVAPTSIGGLFVQAAAPDSVKAALDEACKLAASTPAYVAAAERAFQPVDYYADSATFKERVAKDIEAKAKYLHLFK